MIRSHITGLALGFAALTLATPALSQSEPRAVVELFTSQGCSSCPAADKLLGELAHDPSIITLTMAVDYWDYLGWKDTLALNGHTRRQRGYASTRGDRQVYTPQAVINGNVHVIGSQRSEIDKAISRMRPAQALSVPVAIKVGAEAVSVNVKAGKETPSAGDVWLCVVTREAQVKIGKGENRGRTVTYHNVVRRWHKVGTWAGGSHDWSVPRSQIGDDGADSVVVLVQAGTVESPGVVLGAATASLR